MNARIAGTVLLDSVVVGLPVAFLIPKSEAVFLAVAP